MEFKTSNAIKNKPVRLQFYRCPPIETIELMELEQFAVDRIKALKCIENISQDFLRGSKDYDEKMISELSKMGSFGKSLVLASSITKNAEEDIRKDIISHFILQVAYCRSEDLRKWFIQHEVELFRFRFLNERNSSSHGSDIISSFLIKNDLKFTLISESERSLLHKELLSGSAAPNVDPRTTAFYKVYFSEVHELVKNRRVFIQSGFAYVPEPDLVSLVVTHFRTSLSFNLARLGLVLGSRLAFEENRVIPLLSSLSSRYLGEDYSNKSPLLGTIKSEQVDILAKQPGVFPPCMAQLHDNLKINHHLRHGGRMQYGLFLKGIGLSLDESLKFWKSAFSPKYDSDQFAKSYAYNIRHNYGKEGKRTDYTPYSCMRIISGCAPGQGDYHGCPFKHMDSELLRQRLSSSGRLNADTVDMIVKRSKEHLFHLSCREYFRGMHKLSVDDITGITIHHPNQYFEESQKILLGEGAAQHKGNDKVHVKKVKLQNMEVDDIEDSVLVEASILDDSQLIIDV